MKTTPDAENVLVNDEQTVVDDDGEYVVEGVDVTATLLSHQGDGRTRDIITAVNTNKEDQSISWEKVRLAPQHTKLTYDAAGNMTSDGRIAYTWNGANHLLSCEDIDLHTEKKWRTEYAYDAQGRRIEKRDFELADDNTSWNALSTTKYLYDGWNIVAAYVTDEKTGDALTNSYIHGADISGMVGGAGGIGGLLMSARHESDGSVTRKQYIYDSQGNVRHLVEVGATPSENTISATYEYDPYGRLVYAVKPPSREIEPQFLYSTKLYESHWQQYYYGCSIFQVWYHSLIALY